MRGDLPLRSRCRPFTVYWVRSAAGVYLGLAEEQLQQLTVARAAQLLGLA
ncbi:hypothetical protein [Peterkaempfera sp. SMS 1(5)a]